jgi:hypothetical protein
MEPKVPERGVTSHQPSVTVVEISDPAIAGQNLELVDLDAVQLTSTPFRARRVVVRLEGGTVLYHSTNHRIRTRTTVQRGLLRGREDDFRLPHGAETLQADAALVRRLFDWGKRLVDTAARQPALFNDRKMERAAAQVEMVETLLATLGATSDLEPAPADHVRQSQSLVVKTAEDYALSHADERVYVTDLSEPPR